MFIKKLIIESPKEVIREIEFRPGLNLIVDETPIEDTKSTGNNVGKTTVLKLIDFCLGANPRIIYTGTENKRDIDEVVKDFLINKEISVTLILTESLIKPYGKQLKIQRNFLSHKKAIRKVNDKPVLDKEFEEVLEKNLMPNKQMEKPTFRQIISHNIRYRDHSINNTLKTLDSYTSDIEYETLNLYLLGCTFNEGAKKQALITKINHEQTFRERLEKKQTKTKYEIALSLLEDEIEVLDKKKSSFNLNESLENDLEQLNIVKYNINKVSSLISKLEIRKNLIEESKEELEESVSNIDLDQIRILYNEFCVNILPVQKTFESLVRYHNNMIVEKVRYIAQDLPELSMKLESAHRELNSLLCQEKELSDSIAKGDSFEELEKVIFELNEKYRAKGEYESIISQLNEVDENISDLNNQIQDIGKQIFSDEFQGRLKNQVKKFNKLFSSISQELYGERYALSYEIVNKKDQQFYKFSSFNANLSSGKKQGEIFCFDLAYLLFAEEEHNPYMHFLLNDKKELMHDNQLIKLAEFVQNKDIQFIASILKDKVPRTVLDKAHIAVKLSQKCKLFKIENDT